MKSYLNGIRNVAFTSDDPVIDGVVSLPIEHDKNVAVARAAAVANYVLESHGDIEHPLLIMDLNNVLIQYKRWMDNLPRITPFYAVKCNSDPTLVAYLQSLGCNFDCASSAEMDLVVNELNHPPDHVVYSNPCKLSSHIEHAKGLCIRKTVVDNVEEVNKLKKHFPRAQILIRLACVDSKSLCPMSGKFGAVGRKIRDILGRAADLDMEVIGCHFHVGSGCSDPVTYQMALADTRRAFDIGLALGHDMHIVDIGGGFPQLQASGECVTFNGTRFEDICSVINQTIDEYFPIDSNPNVKFFGEPGRFFAGGSSALLTKIHSKSVEENEIRYSLNDGVYGSFNCVFYDNVTLRPYPLKNPNRSPAQIPAVLFGPTCDGIDKIMENVTNLPDLAVGERVIWLGMGAYTSAAATRFNGFDTPKYFHYKSIDNY
jgi:ornithine decarboxylase